MKHSTQELARYLENLEPGSSVPVSQIVQAYHLARCADALERLGSLDNTIIPYEGRVLRVTSDETGQYVVDRNGRRVFLEFDK